MFPNSHLDPRFNDGMDHKHKPPDKREQREGPNNKNKDIRFYFKVG